MVAGNIAFPKHAHHAALSPSRYRHPIVVTANVNGGKPANFASNLRAVFVV